MSKPSAKNRAPFIPLPEPERALRHELNNLKQQVLNLGELTGDPQLLTDAGHLSERLQTFFDKLFDLKK